MRENCRRFAITARNAEAADKFQKLAETWDSLAAELDSARVFLDTMGELGSDQTGPPQAA
jgi:hypothetical protein